MTIANKDLGAIQDIIVTIPNSTQLNIGSIRTGLRLSKGLPVDLPLLQYLVLEMESQ